ncbi:MAG TPA: uracil-DNA glycosylase [Planctomycetota bacterium]
MPIEPSQLQQHLELAASAYGFDLPLPAGKALPRAIAPPGEVRVAAPTPVVSVSPAPAAASPAAAPVPAPTTPGAPTAPTAPKGPATPEQVADLQALRAEVMPCTRCKLHQGRQHVVFGEGNPSARVLFVGEAPGAVEDQTGRPFVGPAGQLLDRILAGAMGLQRSDVYIANINKCRPPGNRVPEPDEVAACLPFLRRQIEIVRPEVIVCLGRTAVQNLLGTTEPMRTLRGRALSYAGVPVVVTWHPAYLLRDPSHKRETWEDIKRVNRLLGLPERPAPPAS